MPGTNLTRAEAAVRGALLRVDTYSVELDFSRPGKPTDNAFIEAFNGRFRSECLRS